MVNAKWINFFKKIDVKFIIMSSFIFLGCEKFGASGSLDLSAKPCIEETSVPSESPCLVPASRYVASTMGNDNDGKWHNLYGTTTVSGDITLDGLLINKAIKFSEPFLLAVNIKTGASIFNVTGGFLSPAVLQSNLYHSCAVAGKSQYNESVIDRGKAYLSGSNEYIVIPLFPVDKNYCATVDRNGWDDVCFVDGKTDTNYSGYPCKCGLNGSIEERIQDCANHGVIGQESTWDGSQAGKGMSGEGLWRLVTRTGALTLNGSGREVWRDERTQLLWSSIVGMNLNWCKASGSNNIPGNPAAESDPDHFCDNSQYQKTSGQSVSACFEDGEISFTPIDGINIDNAGKGELGISSSPKAVDWRLPTIYDFKQANINGLQFVIPDPNYANWTATLSAQSSGALTSSLGMLLFNNSIATGNQGGLGYQVIDRNVNLSARCVGRVRK